MDFGLFVACQTRSGCHCKVDACFWSLRMACAPALSPAFASLETCDKGHGRLETRHDYQNIDLEWFADLDLWESLRPVGMVESPRESGGKHTRNGAATSPVYHWTSNCRAGGVRSLECGKLMPVGARRGDAETVNVTLSSLPDSENLLLRVKAD